ncbi:MAG: 2-phospho-L-lactate transferase [Halobacteriales archaeon]
MVTLLSGGTGTPKLLAGIDDTSDVTVIGNTGDDIEIAGHLVCPDIDTVLFLAAGILDRETWWGIDEDTTTTHDRVRELTEAAGLAIEPRYLKAEAQTTGRRLATWRRFSGVGEFMTIGDHDRAIHLLRTGLLDEGFSLTEATRRLTTAFDIELELLPMSDDPVASMIHTPEQTIHFQEFWVAERGEPPVEDVEFRGAAAAEPTDAVMTALQDPVVIGPSNPVTSIGPMLALDSFRSALDRTPVVAVSPFVEDEVFSGPAAKLMAAVGYDPSTWGVAEAFPFADAFVLDTDDCTELDRPTVRTDTTMDDPADAARVYRTVQDALREVR